MAKTNYKSLTDILKFYGEKIVKETKSNLDTKKKNASSSLRQSIVFDIKIFGSVYTFSVLLNPYWYWIDKGRKPGGDFGTIYAALKGQTGWISRKGLINRKEVGEEESGRLGKKVSKAKLSSLTKNLNSQFAYFAAKKIVREGFEGSNFFSDVVNEKLYKDMQTDISTFLKRDIQLQVIDLAKETFKK